MIKMYEKYLETYSINWIYSQCTKYLNKDENLFKEIISENSHKEFMIKVYEKFCEVNQKKYGCLVTDHINKFFNKNKVDRYLSINKIIKKGILKDFINFMTQDNLLVDYIELYSDDYFPVWMYLTMLKYVNVPSTFYYYYKDGQEDYRAVKDINFLSNDLINKDFSSVTGFLFCYLEEDISKRNTDINRGQNFKKIEATRYIRAFHKKYNEYVCIISLFDLVK